MYIYYTVLLYFICGTHEKIAYYSLSRILQDTSIIQNGEVRDFLKACRFKRGFRLPHKEVSVRICRCCSTWPLHCEKDAWKQR